jgi:hypothetical protein
MTLSETAKLLALIQVYYPKFAEGRDINVTAKAWQMIFAEDDYDRTQKAVLAFVATDTKGFPPMPGALKELMFQRPDTMSAMQAWHLVRKAVENGWYGSEEEFKKLPPLCQRIVGAPGTLKDWALMDMAELETVVGSNFQRSYKQLEKDEAYFAKLPQAVLQALPGVEKLGLMP